MASTATAYPKISAQAETFLLENTMRELFSLREETSWKGETQRRGRRECGGRRSLG